MTPPAAALGIPVVIARRSVIGSPAERRALFRIPIRWAERRARLVTGNSNAVIEEAEGPRRPPGAAAPGPQRTPAGGGAAPAPPGDAVALGYLANYRPEKGHARLLDALELVDAETPWRVDLVGSGPLREQVAAEIAARGSPTGSTRAARSTDVRGFWAEHDVAVLLSDDEGSPNALIEAAMLGPAAGRHRRRRHRAR